MEQAISVNEIDNLGIRVATELSMIRALKKLKEKPSELIIDGPYYYGHGMGFRKIQYQVTRNLPQQPQQAQLQKYIATILWKGQEENIQDT